MCSIHPYCINIVCLYRKQSTSGHPGAKLSFIEAVCAVGRPLYNQRRPPSMPGGTSPHKHGGFTHKHTWTVTVPRCQPWRIFLRKWQKVGGQRFKNCPLKKKGKKKLEVWLHAALSLSCSAFLGILHFPLISWYFWSYLKPLIVLKVDSFVVMTISSLKNTNQLSKTKKVSVLSFLWNIK